MNKTVIKRVTTLLLLVALCATIAIALVACESKSDVIAVDDKGNEYNGSKVYDMPSGITFVNDVNAVTDKSITLRATVKPDNATNKALTWSVVWVDAGNEWATGKNIGDYLTISASGTVGTLTCKQPFGAQAKVVAISIDNPDAKAECVLDYKAKLDIKLEYYYANKNTSPTPTKFAEDTVNNHSIPGILGTTCVNHDTTAHNAPVKLINWANDPLYDEYRVKVVPVYGVGTIFDTVKIDETEYSDFSNGMTNKIKQKHGFYLTCASDTLHMTLIDDNTYTMNYVNLILVMASALANSENAVGYVPLTIDDMYKEAFDCCLMEVGIRLSIGGVANSRYVYTCFGLDEATCKYFKVESVRLDQSTIII